MVSTEIKDRRSNRLREKMLTAPGLCIERGALLTESYQETEGEPIITRKAKAMKKILSKMTIGIDDGELIVGRITSKQRGGALTPELRWEWYLDEMDIISTREWDRFAPLSEDEKQKMKEFLPYWKGISLYDKWLASVPESTLKLDNVVCCAVPLCGNNLYADHTSPDYERILVRGYGGLQKQVNEELAKLNLTDVQDFKKYQFLTAINITLEAAGSLIKRYADLARNMSETEGDARRKAELDRIAGTCDWIATNPARNFYEALQSIWFTYVIALIEGWGSAIGFGRPDQFLYPFYKKDIEAGHITREEAQELIELFLIKINSGVLPFSTKIVRSFAGLLTWTNITLGGITKEGWDAVNDLSYLFLDAEKNVGLAGEDFVIRINKKTPDAFVIKALEVAKQLKGKFKFLSDETTIKQLLGDGKTIECARDYVVNGCFVVTVPGHSQDSPAGNFNLPLMLELALNNGVSRLTGEQIGPETGDPRNFKSYDKVWQAYKKQLKALLPAAIIFRNVDRQLYADYAPLPFQSALFHGCIENGIDVTKGGANYTAQQLALAGIPNVGDSLAAIKKIVFEDKKITMDRLIDALDKNFEGEEEVLHYLMNAPKYGNDNDYVDSIVNEVLTVSSKEVTDYKGAVDRSRSTVNLGVATANIPMGYMVGALPDGRKAGEPLSEGGISPYQGRNVSGPTATFSSVAKLDHLRATGGSVLNMRFNPDALKDEAKIKKLALMIRTYAESGGTVVQFNIIGTDILRDAQKTPEKYKDLLVRVATYSAYFVELSKELQDDIIARMEFQEV